MLLGFVYQVIRRIANRLKYNFQFNGGHDGQGKKGRDTESDGEQLKDFSCEWVGQFGTALYACLLGG